MTPRERFVSRSGLSLRITPYHEATIPDRDALGLYYEVEDASSTTIRVCVAILAPMVSNVTLQHARLGTLAQVKDTIARFAILDGADADAELLGGDEPVKRIWLDGQALQDVLKRPKWGDRDIRRYLSRRVYDQYSRTTMSEPVMFDPGDYSYAGATHQDFLRCGQLLASEGYLTIKLMSPMGGFAVVPTSKLIREVERYGAAREDVASEEDYVASLKVWPSIRSYEGALVSERIRYQSATTVPELLSVFRATAPMVEAVARDLLANHGSAKSHSSLGPIIADLQSRHVIDIAIVSQLDHVLKFARDLVQHGQQIPLVVLRIACENAFALVPQLGALFK